MITNQQILNESLKDLTDDFSQLDFLANSAVTSFDKFISSLNNSKRYIRFKTYSSIFKDSKYIKERFAKISAKITSYKDQASKGKLSKKHLNYLSEAKESCFDLLRSYYGILGSLVTSLDWQSPSFTHSLFSQAGTQTGKIKGTFNDYKRDRHLDEEEYEKLYLKEYIDAPLKFSLRALLTANGMAAFTTILNYLMMDGKTRGKVIAGNSSYFQYKQLLAGIFQDRIIWVNEMETERLINTIEENRPDAIFLDSLCNAKNIPVPNLKSLIDYLTKSYKKELYLVIDNTCLSIFSQPFQFLFGRRHKVHLIIFESLMKYVHFGLDKVTGGVIVAQGKDATRLFEYRKHSGTNITDSSVYSLPIPNRKMLEKRLLRFQRNAFLLASSLQEYIENKKNCLIEKIVYPGLPNHKAYHLTKNLLFQESFFNIEFRKKSIKVYKKFIDLVILEAKKRKIQLVGGTSFGLNNTRVYLTSLWTLYGEPFLRVAAGTENRFQVEILKDVFRSAIDKIGRGFL